MRNYIPYLYIAALLILGAILLAMATSEPAPEIGTALYCEQVQGVVHCIER